MNLFGRRRESALTPSWHYTAEGVIWQVMPDGVERIVGEERDTERRSVRFFCVETATGRILWERQSFGEPWWIGLQAASGGLLFLHGFASPDLPGLKGITSVDLATGRVLWRASDLTLLHVRDGVLRAIREVPGGQTIVELDPATGTPIAPAGGVSSATPSTQGLLLPAQLEGSPDGSVRSYLRRCFPAESRAGAIEYLQSGRLLAFSHWVSEAGEPRRGGSAVLRIVDTSADKILYRDLLLRASPRPAMPLFFLLGELLCYVKERRTLTAVRLSVPPG